MTMNSQEKLKIQFAEIRKIFAMGNSDNAI